MRYKKIYLLILISLITGCAYYNTFYNAEQYYKEAEDLRKANVKRQEISRSDVAPPESTTVSPRNANDLYEQAIKKASKVLSQYPSSKYVPNALFLIGMSYFRLGEYDNAIRKFDELQSLYPDHKFVKEAEFYRAYSYLLSVDYTSSQIDLNAISLEEDELSSDALFLIAEIAYFQKDYTKANQNYSQFVELNPNHPNRYKAYLRLGEIAFNNGNFAKAIEHYNKIDKSAASNIYFVSKLNTSRAYAKMGKPDESIDMLSSLLSQTVQIERRSTIELLMADIYYENEKLDDAEKLWTLITEKYPKTEASAKAYFMLGELYQRRKQELDKAEEMYNQTISEAPRTELAEMALSRNKSIGQLKAIRADSLGAYNTTLQLENYFKMAELYLLDLELPDSALSIYNLVIEEFPDHRLVCKARYGKAWIYANSYNKLNIADSLYSIVLDSCLDTDWAVDAVEYYKIRGTAIDSTKIQTPAYLFIKAEEFFFTYQWPDSAIKYYEIVTQKYPNSNFAPKAFMAIASILSESNPESSAVIYQLVTDKYPQTEYSSESQIRLGMAVRKSEIEQKETKEDKGSIYEEEVSKREDTSRQSEIKETPSLPYAPYPKYRAPLIYPDQEFSSAIENKPVKLKILINSFGEVTDAELLTTSDNRVIDQAILEAAKETTFDPLKIDITQYNTWFLYEIRVTKPERERY